MKMEAEAGAMCLQVKDHQGCPQPPEAGGQHGTDSLSGPQELPADSPVSDIWPHEQ